jgi:polyhydroxyalkanoate synthesis repressor PhaR
VATVLIKKYGNRRLYDTSDSRYVTLDELAGKIRAGNDLRIVDAQTGEDLTQATLTQIVLETGNAAKFLPVQLLTQMIRLSDDALAEFFSRYVTGALDVYLQAKRGMQSIASFNPLTQLPMAATDALARMWMGSPFGGPTAYPPPYPGYSAPPPPYPVPAPEPPPDDSEGPRKRSERADTEPGRRKSSQNIAPESEEPRTERNERNERNGADRAERSDDIAAMRRELDELKAALRESLPKKRKKTR